MLAVVHTVGQGMLLQVKLRRHTQFAAAEALGVGREFDDDDRLCRLMLAAMSKMVRGSAVACKTRRRSILDDRRSEHGVEV